MRVGAICRVGGHRSQQEAANRTLSLVKVHLVPTKVKMSFTRSLGAFIVALVVALVIAADDDAAALAIGIGIAM